MSRLITNTTLIRRDRLRQLKERESGWHDLQFIKAMAPQHRSRCIDLLDQGHSQIRQDLFALAQLDFKEGGFFVEFGATNGVSLSNTCLMERAFGWTGILAEPSRGWHDELRQNRTATIDTRCVWKETGSTVQFTQARREVNSAISEFASAKDKLRGSSYEVKTISLNDLLSEHGAPEHIDYMSVDTEGSEFDILQALDFDRWSFGVLTVEHAHLPQQDDIHALLSAKGYKRVLTELSMFDDWYIRAN